MGQRTCVLLSGGLDSAALVAHFLARGHRVAPVYVSGGLRWEKAEFRACRAFLKDFSKGAGRRLEPLRLLRLDQRDLQPPGHWSLAGSVPGRTARWTAVYLRGRNLLLFSKAGVLCAELGVGRMAIGTLKGNPFLDARPVFFRAVERALRLGLGATIRIETPFRGFEKRDLVRRGGVRWELTFSCIRPVGSRHCGVCTKCVERRRAFKFARVPDPTEYAA